MIILLTKTDSQGGDAIIMHAAQAILDAIVNLESEIRAKETLEGAARLGKVIQRLEERLIRLNNLAVVRFGRQTRRRNHIVPTVPILASPLHARHCGGGS